MGFKARINMPDLFVPARVYVHEAGFEDVFLDVDGAEERFRQHHADYEDMMKHLHGVEYAIVALWGNGDTSIIEYFGFADVDPWPGNPDVSSFVLKNGVYDKDRELIGCGDTMMILGAEEEFRRTTTSLDDYMRNPPELSRLGGIEPKIDYTIE